MRHSKYNEKIAEVQRYCKNEFQTERELELHVSEINLKTTVLYKTCTNNDLEDIANLRIYNPQEKVLQQYL